MSAILDVAQSHLRRVQHSGNELSAVCPFHRRPDGSEGGAKNFYMNLRTGLWFCHSCHARGNFYSFLRNIGMPHVHIVEFHKTALEEAERNAPAPPDPKFPAEPTTEPLEEGFLGIFDYYPALMAEWGFPPELCKRFGVGFDARHNRITFPLRSMNGRLVGISGRTVTGEQPRYKVYDTEYLAFNMPYRKTEKRALLWNAHEALAALALLPVQDRIVVVVEGFKGAMRVAQAGIGTVVALLGSHLSNEQKWFLAETEASICLMFDNNNAGREGLVGSTEPDQRSPRPGAADRLLPVVHSVRVVDYDAEQPSDLTTEEVLASVAAAVPFAAWKTQRSRITS
jgi:DNA primase